MRARFAVPAAVSLALSASCGGGPPSPPGLAYGLPTPAVVTYVAGDTANMDIDAGGQTMQASVAARVTLATTFSRGTDGIQVSMEVTDLDARVTNPMASASADESGVEGALVFTLDRRGAATVVSQPTVDLTASQVFQPLTLAHSFFPRLPGRAAGVGESWTDTIRFRGPQGPGEVTALYVVTYTVAGDSVVAGRSVVKLDLAGTTEQSAKGVITGADFSQTVSGTVTGWVLFDVGRSLLVESYAEADARGSMDVSAAPFPLGVRVRGQSRVKLQEGT